jgi:hypothetical protein
MFSFLFVLALRRNETAQLLLPKRAKRAACSQTRRINIPRSDERDGTCKEIAPRGVKDGNTEASARP